MAVAVVQSPTKANAAAATAISLTPATPTPGRLLVAALGFIGTGTATPPAGWQSFYVGYNGTNCALGLYTRTGGAQVGDPATWTWTCSVSDFLSLAFMEFSSAAVATPVFAANNAGAGTSVTTPAATPIAPNSLPIGICTENTDFAFTPGSGFSSLFAASQSYHSLYGEIAPLTSAPIAGTFGFANTTAQVVAAILLIAPGGTAGNSDNPGGAIGNGQLAGGTIGNGNRSGA